MRPDLDKVGGAKPSKPCPARLPIENDEQTCRVVSCGHSRKAGYFVEKVTGTLYFVSPDGQVGTPVDQRNLAVRGGIGPGDAERESSVRKVVNGLVWRANVGWLARQRRPPSQAFGLAYGGVYTICTETCTETLGSATDVLGAKHLAWRDWFNPPPPQPTSQQVNRSSAYADIFPIDPGGGSRW